MRTAAHEYAARVNLGSRADIQVANLSHGEQRRLEVAMALASDARLLLLDEPLAGLGPEEASEMITLLEDIERTANHRSDRARHGRCLHIGGSHISYGLWSHYCNW